MVTRNSRFWAWNTLSDITQLTGLLTVMFKLSSIVRWFVHRLRRYKITIRASSSSLPPNGGWVRIDGETNLPFSTSLYVKANNTIIRSFESYGTTFSERVFLPPNVLPFKVSYNVVVSDNPKGN